MLPETSSDFHVTSFDARGHVSLYKDRTPKSTRPLVKMERTGKVGQGMANMGEACGNLQTRPSTDGAGVDKKGCKRKPASMRVG